MTNIIAQYQKTSYPFADKKVLFEQGTLFCIKSVRLVTQKDGKERWYSDIEFTDVEGPVTQTMTLDRTAKRDVQFSKIVASNDLPQHNCWLEKGSFNNKLGMKITPYELRQNVDALECTRGCLAETSEDDEVYED